jgi:O-antigen/teichoic acid export membrane protein
MATQLETLPGESAGQGQVRDGLIYLLPVLVGGLVPLLTLPVLTRVLSPTDYGYWGLSTAYAMFASTVANCGSQIGYERNFFECSSREQHAELIYSTFGFVLGTYLLVGLLTWIFRRPLAAHLLDSVELAPLLVVTYLAVGMSSLKLYFLIYFKNTANATAYVWYTIDETVLTGLASVVLVAVLRVGVLGLALGSLLANSVVMLLLCLRFVQELRPRFRWAPLRGVLRISAPLIPRVFLGGFGNQLDKYLIGMLSSVSDVGLYTVGQRITSVLGSALNALQNVYVPRVYQRMFTLREEGAASIGRYLTPFAYASVGFALLVALFAEELITVLTPDSFRGALYVIGLLALYNAVTFFGRQPQLQYLKKTGLISVVSFGSLFANAASMYVGIRMAGAYGAAAGFLAGGTITGAVMLALGQHYFKIDYEWRRLAVLYALLVAAACSAMLLHAYGVPYPLRLAVKLGFVAAYVWTGAAKGLLTMSHMRQIHTALAPRAAAPR